MTNLFDNPEARRLVAELARKLEEKFRVSPADAHDLGLRALEKTHEQFVRWEAGERQENPWTRAYLWTVAKNLWHSARRSRLVPLGDFADGVSSDTDPTKLLSDAERRTRVADEVNRAVAQLTDTVRPAAILRHYYEMAWRDIAEVLGLGEGAQNIIEQRVKRSRKELRKRIRVRGVGPSATKRTVRTFLLGGIDAELSAGVSELRRTSQTEANGSLTIGADPRVREAWGIVQVLRDPLGISRPFPILWSESATSWTARFSATFDLSPLPDGMAECDAAGVRIFLFQADYLRLW